MEQEVIVRKKSHGSSILGTVFLAIISISLIVEILNRLFLFNGTVEAISTSINGIGVLYFLYNTDFSDNLATKSFGIRIWYWGILALALISGVWKIFTWLF
ncbi:hypothetical protein [Enterococcus sp. RIT-PI-f]|uniref:hypothetical protein n=1 Tax=Enterococcus sp. RIT-PI-f TaxID=1690244 RepID=UPI0006B88615|nr:hypothetical protein [Enterococcus sp. RIT-PI-f]KPG69954.1 hypothetical protein AEQ18_11085 [Enterococcus sp. RIT-PI-f]